MLAGCAASACDCPGPQATVADPEVQAGETVTVELTNLLKDCCDTGGGLRFWDDNVYDTVDVRLVAKGDPDFVYAETVVDVDEDATATATLTVPADVEPGDSVNVAILGGAGTELTILP